MRHDIRFLRRGKEIRLSDVSPTLTLLDYLRLHERSTGTKEGCAEGDCGACTVVVRRVVDGALTYEMRNACISFLGQNDGCDIITVEDLADATLHPVQQALVETHGSQCGFCTPGFVMALFGLFHAPKSKPLDRDAVNQWIAGNLCRCTGYRPIVDAALQSCTPGARDGFSKDEAAVTQRLDKMGADGVFVGTQDKFFAAPISLEALAELYRQHPDAALIGGATDVGLWVTKQLRDLRKIIWLGRVRGLDTIDETADAITFGAMVSHQSAMPHLATIDPDLGELMRRFASVQIRNVGTIGGNIANGSPIGDTPPALIALGATLSLQRGDKTRSIPLEDFFIAYGKQDRADGEFVRSIRVPKLKSAEYFRCYKMSKRYDQDISAVMGAFKVSLEGPHIKSARIAFGGMAATPKRAREAEARLVGADLRLASDWQPAIDALARDFSPIDDARGSAAYRSHIAGVLLSKALTEITGAPTHQTRVTGLREATDAAP
ncbi:MAG: xanthine dehydrogenase small subunit [Xanthobacteraceae bacterium]